MSVFKKHMRHDLSLSGVRKYSRNCLGLFFCLLLASCGGGSSVDAGTSTGVTAPPPVVLPPLAANEVPVIVDSGPAGTRGIINQAYVSVTVCRPGTTVCQTIDHVLLDTGSVGLRLIASAVLGLDLPLARHSGGLAIGECAKFASGYQWGSVRQADVKMAGELASSLSIHLVADASPEFASVPADCQSAGHNLGSVAALGANGILGLGFFKQDCGQACVGSASSGDYYYACGAGFCSNSVLPLAQQVSNPVASFSQNNNGVLMVMPGIASGGATKLTGSLIFGVGTQSNNLIVGETVYAANSSGNFTTTYNGKALTASFLDSGSNGYFFEDKTIPVCTVSTSFYCPKTVTAFSAINRSFDGRSSGLVNFRLDAVDNLTAGIVAAQIAGGGGGFSAGFVSNSFDWGLPFFFGRRVFIAMQGVATPNGNGPYWAY
jgi:hypothetical protein